jgi:hypothetical protein
VSPWPSGREWTAGGSDDWDREVARFFDGLAALDVALAAEGPFAGKIDKIIQGLLADALTHVGQLALHRGISGARVRPESYARGDRRRTRRPRSAAARALCPVLGGAAAHAVGQRAPRSRGARRRRRRHLQRQALRPERAN